MIWSGLLSRIVVAVVALPAVLALVWLGGWWMVALALGVALLALHEYAALIRPLRPLVLAAHIGAILAVVGAHTGGLEWMLGGFLITLVVAFVLQGVAGTRQTATVAIGATVLGSVWIGLGLAHLVLIRDIPAEGRLAIFAVLLAVFAADTAAFFAGRLLGRHKLAPIMSPGKTWEGFAAGLAAAVAVAFFALYREGFMDGWRSLVLGAVVAVAGLLGDLFESAIKRDMEVKDSGRLLGAHGGILDRLDAPLFAAPAAFYLMLALA